MIPAEILNQSLDAIRHTDIYLIDLILKRYFSADMRVLDAGCGMGRNVEYFLQAGFDTYGADISDDDVDYLRKRARQINPAIAPENFRVEALENLSFDAESMDVIICSAVLHFALDEAHFMAMLGSMWQILKPGGMFFARLASSIGIEDRIRLIEGRRFQIPDGSSRFLVDEKMLLDITENLGAQFLEPIKTTNVQNMRAMTTWVVRKGGDI